MYLAIETSSLVSSIALGTAQKLMGEITVQANLTHSEQLLPHIDAILQYSCVDKNDLKGIIVSIGPGSFTGLRIGLGTAKALSYGLNIPLIGIETSKTIAHNFFYTSKLIAVLIDAQKNNVYFSLYGKKNSQIFEIQPIQVRDLDEVLHELAQLDQEIIFAGDASVYEADYINNFSAKFQVANNNLAIARAESLLYASSSRIDNEDYDEVMSLVPFYLRRSEAEVLWDKKHGVDKK